MTKRVLDVGNCDLDFTNISELMRDQFAAEVHRAHGKADALQALQREKFDLVTVNRLLDRDGSQGLEIIKSLKEDPTLAMIPVMLITNFPEQQQIACEAGAVPGFGKAALQAAETIELLKPYLAT
jgi:CheY-like chemotaxis protein